ncbi:hypothetical protein B0H16DRAFT_1578679 [Mycena metata]|uniref:Secreted protein n=1 Tax=Mycena metata TaxID=1033252 RepID=A0AAD7I2X3_9AGAR|nr:hypothetical protein B0H16DRAFT_1578679 [Mycena metata]
MAMHTLILALHCLLVCSSTQSWHPSFRVHLWRWLLKESTIVLLLQSRLHAGTLEGGPEFTGSRNLSALQQIVTAMQIRLLGILGFPSSTADPLELYVFPTVNTVLWLSGTGNIGLGLNTIRKRHGFSAIACDSTAGNGSLSGSTTLRSARQTRKHCSCSAILGAYLLFR